MPLLRFRTGILFQLPEKCACGEIPAPANPSARRNVSSGTTLFPNALFHVLTDEGIDNYYLKYPVSLR